MRLSTAVLAGCLAGLLLVACGYRGPLYLPGEEPARKSRRAPPPAPSPQPATLNPAGGVSADPSAAPARADR